MKDPVSLTTVINELWSGPVSYTHLVEESGVRRIYALLIKNINKEKWGGHFSKEDYNIFQEMDKTEESLR